MGIVSNPGSVKPGVSRGSEGRNAVDVSVPNSATKGSQVNRQQHSSAMASGKPATDRSSNVGSQPRMKTGNDVTAGNSVDSASMAKGPRGTKVVRGRAKQPRR